MPVRTAKKIAQALNVEWWKLYEEDGDDMTNGEIGSVRINA